MRTIRRVVSVSEDQILEDWGWPSPFLPSPTPGQPHRQPPRNLPIGVRIADPYKSFDNGSRDYSATFRRLPDFLARPKLVQRHIHTCLSSKGLAQSLLDCLARSTSFKMTSSEQPSSSRIRVIVVGAGFAGLTAAIECHRKGHDVLLLESFPELKILGDIISFAPNSGRIFQRWPGVDDQLNPIIHKSDGLLIKTYLGETLTRQTWEKERPAYGKAYNGHRGEIHEIVYRHALDIGIDIRLGHKVDDYFETDDEAGVIANGERFVGDVVLAADGVRSKGRTIVLGYEDKPKSSGYAIYRTWFDSAKLAEDPDTAWMVVNGDKHCAWLGKRTLFLHGNSQTDVEQALTSILLQLPLRMEKNLAGFVRTK
jgi:hypothetical protein